MRHLLIVAMIGLLGSGIGLVVWEPTGEYSEFCELAIPLAGDEMPKGWEYGRDHYNNCAVTVFNDQGDRAPAELYDALPINPPPELPPNRDALGWAMIVGSLVGGALILWTSPSTDR